MNSTLSLYISYLFINIHVSVKTFKHLNCLRIVKVDHILHVAWCSLSNSDGTFVSLDWMPDLHK